MGSSRTRAQTCVPCVGRRILNHCATREALLFYIQVQVVFQFCRPLPPLLVVSVIIKSLEKNLSCSHPLTLTPSPMEVTSSSCKRPLHTVHVFNLPSPTCAFTFPDVSFPHPSLSHLLSLFKWSAAFILLTRGNPHLLVMRLLRCSLFYFLHPSPLLLSHSDFASPFRLRDVKDLSYLLFPLTLFPVCLS